MLQIDMTRKDYELIAEVIKGIEGENVVPRNNESVLEGIRRKTAVNFARKLSQTNPRFNEDRFLTACGVKL